MLPQTWVQILIILVTIIPGFVYQITRRTLRGPSPDELEVPIRILRAVSTSVAFAGLYILACRQSLLDLFRSNETTKGDPRYIAAIGLLLVIIFPWLAAHATFYFTTATWWLRFRAKIGAAVRKRFGLRRAYTPDPTAWDFAFRRTGPTWVRVLTEDGRWMGGWFDESSFASSYPHPRELYLEKSFEMKEDGAFTGRVAAESGIYIRCEDIVTIEFPTGNEPSEPGKSRPEE
ncbi:DUF6338 family protein [Amycolatopsis xylanica]|nr:DUF6338 family protein [Amycolatopsis xylanica]